MSSGDFNAGEIIAALNSAGFVILPKEPDDSVYSHVFLAITKDAKFSGDIRDVEFLVKIIYRAMLKAAQEDKES